MNSINNKSRPLAALALVAITAGLTACANVAYRCPLDSSEKADSPTACVGMAQSLDAAKKGLGGKQSVLLDEKGKLVTSETNKRGLQVIRGSDEPYAEPSGSPQYEQPKVFQAWTPAYIDKSGNLHDGRNSYFATPGEWRYGTVSNVNGRGGEVGENLLRPARVGDLPSGRVISPAELSSKKVLTTPAVAAAPSEKVVLQNLSDSAQRAAAQTPAQGSKQAAPGVTAPGVKLSD